MGILLGIDVGLIVGTIEDGADVGFKDGGDVGIKDGRAVGFVVGFEGIAVGNRVGVYVIGTSIQISKK